MDRTLPNDIDAERAALGSVLLNRDALPALDGWLRPDHFYLEKHAWIYEAMQACYRRRVPPDTTTVSAELKGKQRLEGIGGISYLIDIANSVPTAMHVEYYGHIVERTGTLRQLITTGGQIAALGFSDPENLPETLANAQSLLTSVAIRGATGMVSAADACTELMTYWEEDDDAGFVPTGIFDMDDAYSGLPRGALILLAARPAVGKSSLANYLGLHMALAQQRRVLMFNAEMNRREVTARQVSMRTGINLGDILRPSLFRRLDDTLRGKAMAVLGELAQSLIWHEDSRSQSVSTIRSQALRMQQEYGAIDLVIVDYLQLLASERVHQGKHNRTLEVGEMSRGLKMLAGELNCPVLALSQLNRDVENRASHTPMLSDLRESGNLEQDADCVIFIHRPELYGKQDEDATGNAELHVAKWRNGPIGVYPIRFERESGRWLNPVKFSAVEGY